MIQISPQSRIFIAHDPINFRSGIDGTAAVCRAVLKLEPMSGAIFVFRNRSGTMIRVFSYDGQGFCLFVKRFSQGRLRWWTPEQLFQEMTAAEIHVLLWGGDPTSSGFKQIWKKVS